MGHWKHFRELYTFQKQFPDGPEVEQGLLLCHFNLHDATMLQVNLFIYTFVSVCFSLQAISFNYTSSLYFNMGTI